MTSDFVESEPGTLYHLIKPAVLLLCTATLLMICLKIIGYGYFPSDDAFRHVAKVVSGKDWKEILVIQDGVKTDSHPGWHTLLGLFYRATGASPTNLLNFSVIILFLIFMIPPAFLFKRPEAWIAALAALAAFSFGPFYRLLFGRPFIFTMFVTLMFCFLWQQIRDKDRPYLELGVYVLLTALVTWIHGAWYFLALPMIALFLARQWRVFLLMSLCTVVGIVLGAMFTGYPFLFLKQMISQAFWAMGSHTFERQLVGELRPYSGDTTAVVLVSLLLIWRKIRGAWDMTCVDNPVFILGAMGWVMGFVALRLWTDWGWTALSFWIATEIQSVFKEHMDEYTLKRLALAAGLCLVLFMSTTSDFGGRWSDRTIAAEWPSIDNVEQRPWLPERGGVLYSDSMDVFYQLFFRNPHGSWRYILGFESTWMPPEDLKIYRQIQLARGKDESYAPWVDKMTDKDRMILVRTTEPKIKGLKWHETSPLIWSGRIQADPVR